MKELIVSEAEANQKIEKYIRKYFPNVPLSLIYKTFRKKDIKVNGKWVDKNYILKASDLVRVYIKDDIENKEVKKVSYNFDIIYEDENVLFINKPVGILVHEGEEKTNLNTLNNQVISYLIDKNEYNPLEKGFVPAPAHRLDRNTGGIIMYGKNLKTLQTLFDLLKDHQNIEKYYLALVKGKVTKKGEINSRLLKDEKTKIVRVSDKGLEALTKYRPLKTNEDFSLLEVEILTGRTHQIRVHLASIGHSIVGDSKYGDFKCNKMMKSKYGIASQFLYAYKLKFNTIEGHLNYLSNKVFEIKLAEKEKKIIDDIFVS